MLAKFLRPRFDLIFFYLFVFSIPFEKRHIFFTERSYLSGHFFEWGGMALYLSDIFLFLCLFFWLIRVAWNRLVTNKKESKELKERNTIVFLFLFFFILFSAISLFFAEFVHIGLYKLARLVEYSLLFFYIIRNIDTFVKLLSTMGIFVLSGVFQAILGIFQFFKQSSFGLKLLGEVDLSPQIPNVAKIIVDQEKLIRSYGTFSHSNVFACFMVFSLIFVIFITLSLIFGLNKVNSMDVSRRTSFFLYKDLGTGLFKLLKRRSKDILAILSLIFCILFFGLVLSFSRQAWIVFLVILLNLVIFSQKIFKIPSFTRLLAKIRLKMILPQILTFLFIVILIAAFLPHIWTRIVSYNQAGAEDVAGRISGTEIALAMVKKSPVFGLGLGNFVLNIQKFSHRCLNWWQYQPVHNIFLLIFAETGVLGLISFIVFLAKIAEKVLDSLNKNILVVRILSFGFLLCFISILGLGFFDHYFMTLQQGSLVFWTILALCANLDRFKVENVS